MREIVFVLETPLTLRDYKRFGIDFLRTQGYKVKVLELTKLLHPKLSDDTKRRFPEGFVLTVKSKSEALFFLENLDKGTCLLLMLGLRWESLWLFRAISKLDLIQSNMLLGSLISPPKKLKGNRFFSRLKLLLSNPYIILDLMVKRSWRILGVNAVRLTMVDGANTISVLPSSPQTKLLHAHSFDYEIYRELKSITHDPLIKDRYFVFVDEYVPFHPDFYVLRRSAPCTAEQYYPRLNRFFEQIERQYGVKVVIAAHPSSQYDQYQDDFFNGRTVIKGQTAELISRSSCVIFHASTAISFAVLFRKPMLFCTMRSFKKFPALYAGIQSNADFFQQVVYDLDASEWTLPMDFKVSENVYRSYVDRYVKKSGSPEAPLWQIFCNALEADVTHEKIESIGLTEQGSA